MRNLRDPYDIARDIVDQHDSPTRAVERLVQVMQYVAYMTSDPWAQQYLAKRLEEISKYDEHEHGEK